MARTRVRAVLAACLIAAGAATAFNGLPRLVEPLAADIGVVLAPREVSAQPDRGMFIDHAPSLCCADFHAGFGGALLAVLVGGFPLSILGISLGTRQRRGDPLPGGRWSPWIYGAFVAQAGSVALATLLLVLGAWEALTSPFGSEGLWVVALFLPTLVCGVLALPSWHSVSTPSPSPQS